MTYFLGPHLASTLLTIDMIPRDERARATFTITCRHCTRVIIENVLRLGDVGTQVLRAHLAARHSNATASAALGDLLFHYSVRDGCAARTESRDESD